MKRKTLATIMCAIGLLGAGASAQRVVSMATLAPAGSTWMRVFDAANREIRRRTNNQLSMRWYPGGVQGDEGEVIQKIRAGRLDGAAVTAVGLGKVHRPVLAFQVPGMFGSQEQFTHARDALKDELQTAFAAQGFNLLGFGETGGTRMFSKTAIRTPNDLRGVHPWQWSDDVILPQVYAEAGATGVRLQVPEVQAALQTNRIDVVAGSPLVMVTLGWAGSVHFMSDRSNTMSLGGLVVSKVVADSIPADQKTALSEVFTQYSALLSRNVRADDERALAVVQRQGIQVVTLTDAERAQWTALFARARTRLVGVVGDAAWIAKVAAAGH